MLLWVRTKILGMCPSFNLWMFCELQHTGVMALVSVLILMVLLDVIGGSKVSPCRKRMTIGVKKK
jgi:hypothetical protein